MKIIVISILLCVLVVNTNSDQMYMNSMGVVGAVYTMTNGVMMNQVIIHCLNATGQLIWFGTINTNGTGVNTAANDPLISQGAMTVFSNYLFVVNAGSNTLSMFMINPMDATQLTLVSVQPTFGWFPISVTVNAQYACVLTGGNVTGIRCFTYSSSGLSIMSSFDRNLTGYISQSIPPNGPQGTLSEILFSADSLSLIVSVKGYNTSARGYLLFYSLNNNGMGLSPTASMQMPAGGVLPFSMTLVGTNGLLITDPEAQGVLTLNYLSTNGTITNSVFTAINASLAGALCWSTYSPMIGNYYVIGASPPGTIVELNLNLSSMSNPVTIVKNYVLPNSPGALETTVVTIGGMDYLYVIGVASQVITIYQLSGPGNASFITSVMVPQQGNTTIIPKIAGIAAYLQTQMSLTSGFFRGTTIAFWPIAIFLCTYSYYEMD